ncbi:MAG: hypothetical protein ACP5HJ_03015 [Candidatus Micrarchaeia archaeon]
MISKEKEKDSVKIDKFIITNNGSVYTLEEKNSRFEGEKIILCYTRIGKKEEIEYLDLDKKFEIRK